MFSCNGRHFDPTSKFFILKWDFAHAEKNHTETRFDISDAPVEELEHKSWQKAHACHSAYI